ncbi:MAG: SDR family oxidoreductase [Candidatus Zixiibacteriota bacterium]|nr:MAG: SDR family oxidoreductase [candidate division Zixibacteria bacterium]
MKRCLITGASRGIGRAIAVKCAADRYDVIAHGRDQNALIETVGLIEASGGRARMMIADLSTRAGIDRIIGDLGKGSLDLLVNNAGVAIVKPFEQISDEEWSQTLAVNVTAPFMLIRGLAPIMPEGSSIVNVLSVAARTGFPHWSGYCMSKFALDGLARSIREELRARRIRVINIYPSAIRTSMWEGIEGDWSADRMVSPDEVAEAVHFAISRPAGVLIEDISVGDISGTL